MTLKPRFGSRLAALLVPLCLCAATVSAEEAGSSDSTTVPPQSKAWQTPTGHRQPRAADAATAKDGLADHIDQINRKLDRDLQICRNC